MALDRTLSPILVLPLVVALVFHPSRADMGTAAHYNPPYTPTACFGSDPFQFHSTNLFAAAGEGIWDNGAACGRQYLVKCISATVVGTCLPDQTIQVMIVDRLETATSRPSWATATIVLSMPAFGAIAKSSVSFINVEYERV